MQQSHHTDLEMTAAWASPLGCTKPDCTSLHAERSNLLSHCSENQWTTKIQCSRMVLVLHKTAEWTTRRATGRCTSSGLLPKCVSPSHAKASRTPKNCPKNDHRETLKTGPDNGTFRLWRRNLHVNTKKKKQFSLTSWHFTQVIAYFLWEGKPEDLTNSSPSGEQSQQKFWTVAQEQL